MHSSCCSQLCEQKQKFDLAYLGAGIIVFLIINKNKSYEQPASTQNLLVLKKVCMF